MRVEKILTQTTEGAAEDPQETCPEVLVEEEEQERVDYGMHEGDVERDLKLKSFLLKIGDWKIIQKLYYFCNSIKYREATS